MGVPGGFRRPRCDGGSGAAGKGFHIVTGPVPYNSDGPVLAHWNAVYKHLTDHGFSRKPVMEGAGRAAGEAYAWAIENPENVTCIYAENPVLRSFMCSLSTFSARSTKSHYEQSGIQLNQAILPSEYLIIMKTTSLLAAATTFFALAASTSTAAIIAGVGQRATSDFPSANRIATHATNGAGLTGTVHVETPNGTMWLSADGDTAGAFEIDLGAVYAINSIRVWNYNEGLAGRPDLLQRGVFTANIEVGLTTSSYVTQIFDQVFAQAPGTNTDFSEVVNLPGTPGRFLRIDILNNYGDAQFSGLSEIQVDGTFVSGQRPLSVSIAGASSTIGAPFNRAPEHTINYSGVFSRTHSITPDGNMWLGAQGDIAPTITFDLGSTQALSNMLFWNYNEFLPGRPDLLDRGAAQGDILLSDDGVNFSLFASDIVFPIAPGDNVTDFAQNINLTGATARYVQIAVDANHGNPEYTGISEVQFFAIPEPSAALLVAAAPLATLLFSRRRRSPAGSI